MKKQLTILLASAFAFPVLAQQTNNIPRERGEAGPEAHRRHERPKHSEMMEAQRKERMERQYQFMEKMLSKIDVSEEDRAKIRTLQETHRTEMKKVGENLRAAQAALSKLLDSGASDEEIEAAIQEVAKSQTEQLRLIVGNRRQMESLLGREKYALLMENARKQFHQHGRRGGSGMPPRPGMPPVPGQDTKGKRDKQPPRPPRTPPSPPSPPPSE